MSLEEGGKLSEVLLFRWAILFGKGNIMNNYIFLTTEGFTFQPNSDAETPDIENLQVIGFANGANPDAAYRNLLISHAYLKDTAFNQIFCYKLDKYYEKHRKDFCIHE